MWVVSVVIIIAGEGGGSCEWTDSRLKGRGMKIMLEVVFVKVVSWVVTAVVFPSTFTHVKVALSAV